MENQRKVKEITMVSDVLYEGTFAEKDKKFPPISYDSIMKFRKDYLETHTEYTEINKLLLDILINRLYLII